MFVQLSIDELHCVKPTESGIFNNRDEVYFTLAGSTSHSVIERPRVSPAPPEDYYGLKAGQTARNIRLWQGFLGEGEYAYLVIVIREQDNAQLSSIVGVVKGAALAIGAIFVDPSLGAEAVGELTNAAKSFVNSLSADSDDVIGAVTARIRVQGQGFTVEWGAVSDVAIASQNTTAASFEATGSGTRYVVRMSAQRPSLPMIVARHSGKCLDVAGASMADQANVQQFTPNGGSNQRWFLKLLGVAPAAPISWLPMPYYAIIAEHSGKCLDVAGGSKEDQANVQQYTPHYGPNQSWFLIPTGEGDSVLLNLHSQKVLDVVDDSMADHANVQQFTYNGGPNQRFTLKH